MRYQQPLLTKYLTDTGRTYCGLHVTRRSLYMDSDGYRSSDDESVHVLPEQGCSYYGHGCAPTMMSVEKVTPGTRSRIRATSAS